MESKEYLRAISQHFLCSMQLAEILVKSAEVNGTKSQMDKIANDQGVTTVGNFKNDKNKKG